MFPLARRPCVELGAKAGNRPPWAVAVSSGAPCMEETNTCSRKRSRLEDLPESATVNKLVELVGRGKLSVSSASDLACCMATLPHLFVKVLLGPTLWSPYVSHLCGFSHPCTEVVDHPLPHRALQSFAGLGSSGKCVANAERDLHRWLRGLWGFELQAYEVAIPLQVAGLTNGSYKKQVVHLSLDNFLPFTRTKGSCQCPGQFSQSGQHIGESLSPKTASPYIWSSVMLRTPR